MPGFVALLALLVAGGPLANEPDQAPEGGPVFDLPERAEVRIPAVLADILADVEKVAASRPGMDRRKAYLITLPLENHLRDVVLSAGRTAVLYPRAMAFLIGQEAAGGADKKAISRLLVTYYQRDAFKKIPIQARTAGIRAAPAGEKR